MVEIYVSVYGDLALVQTQLEGIGEPTTEQMTEILRLNYEMDLVKVALDGDGVVSVLNEASLRLLDGQALAQIVEAVAAVADEVAALLSGSP